MEGGRIQHGPTSYYSVVFGVVGVLVIAASVFIYSRMETEKAKNRVYDPNKPLPSEAQIRATLTEDQYRVVRQNGTETAFRNEYWDNKRPGIYVDVISGEPLFTSIDKYDAGTGRPTFTKPIDKNRLISKEDDSFDMKRIEIRAKKSDAHLGHWFADPTTPTGERYAVNSAGLKFIPAEKLARDGYSDFVPLFQNATEPNKQ
ncbi:MAG TPA: peptide-methionine (R)-S-oxide reductase MsrB [Chthoniobacterales bacterium]|nr:peptide-methionine (R)-S-oxide reductase MsrB [Chthoniobacterales bacterium]